MSTTSSESLPVDPLTTVESGNAGNAAKAEQVLGWRAKSGMREVIAAEMLAT